MHYYHFDDGAAKTNHTNLRLMTAQGREFNQEIDQDCVNALF
jgi:hypothetical protein